MMKGYKAKSAKRQAHRAKSGGNQVQPSESPLLTQPQKMCLIPLIRVVTARVNYSLPVSLEAQCPVFTGGWLRKHLLHGTHPNPRLAKGKQVFSINHIACTYGLTFLSILAMVGTSLQSEFPCFSQSLNFQAGLFKDSSLRPAVNSLLHKNQIY